MLSALRDDVQTLREQFGLSELSLLDHAWETEMGSWSTMARLIALDHQGLVIEVTSAPALQELSLRRQEILRRLNKHFAKPFLRRIQLKIADH